MIPENDQQRNDVIDFIIDGMQDVRKEKQDDGTTKNILEFNPDIAWYKGHMINQPFGRMALYIKRLERLAIQAEQFMTVGRAAVLKNGLMLIVDEYKRSIDAKSSETYKDDNNTQNSLVNVLSKNKVERQYTIKGDAKGSFLDGLLHKDREREED